MPIRMTTKQIAIKVARELRKNQTVAEIKFWSHVRGRKFWDYKFQRQFPIFYEYYGRERFFIADFIAASYI
jgi:very-short-patch-repair endonuclease